MNLQHTKVRNRLEPHRVEKLLYVQINKRQFRAEPPPIITQEMLLEEEDDEMERALQRKQVQDHLSGCSEIVDPISNSVSNPEPNNSNSTLNSASDLTNPRLSSINDTIGMGSNKGKKRPSEWPHGVADH